MSDAKVTVLMLAYNAEEYIREAIDSILNQTFRDFELLIILDSKTSDLSKDIIKTYMDKRIRLIENKKSMNLSELRNKGLRLAKGEYIAIMDADDISYPNRLEVQYKYMEKNPDVGIVGSWNEVIDDVGRVIEFWNGNHSSEDIYYILNFRNCLTHCSTLFRKDLVVNNGGYNETMNLSEDYELYNRISKIARIYQIQQPLVKWRRHNNSIGLRKRNELIERANSVVRDNLEHLIEEKIDNKLLCFIQDNFGNINYDYLDILTKNEFLHSVQLVNEINEKIIDNAPYSLNKKNIRKISKRKISNYICIAILKMGILNSMQYITKYTKGNVLLKIKIITLVIYRYLRYCMGKS
jgi:glycosyltransferase involved in cell wall biosynthesis